MPRPLLALILSVCSVVHAADLFDKQNVHCAV